MPVNETPTSFRDAGHLLLIGPSRQLMAELSPLLRNELPESTPIEYEGYPSTRQLGAIPGAEKASICFLDASSDAGAAMTTIPLLVAFKPDLLIVVLLSSAEPKLILQTLRQGAHEFLTRPFESDQLREVLEKLSRRNPALSAERGRITVVIPAKGACGATTIATNLAIHMKRCGEERVLLADLDPLTGTVSFLLKLKSTYSFLDALAHASTLDADLWRGLVTPSQGVDVLLPPDVPADGVHQLQSALPILDFARRIYDQVVVDVGSIYGQWTASIGRAADEVLVVSTNELPALQATMRGLSYLESVGVPRHKTKLIINRYNKDAGLTKEMIETALHVEVHHLVPSDYETVQRALLEGKAIPTSTQFGKSLQQMAAGLLGHPVKDPDEEASKRRPSLGFASFFKAFSRG